MGYVVGVSSGFWNIARDPALLGIAQKVGGFGATAGIQFNQIDLETPAEFYEPDVKQQVKRTMKELDIKVGLHAEIGGMAAFESAERRIWQEAHKRIVETIKFCREVGFVYINLHSSSEPQLQFEEPRLRPFGHQYQVVAPDGSSLPNFCKRVGGDATSKALELFKESYTFSTDDDVRINKINELKKKIPEKVDKEIEKYVKSPEFAVERQRIIADADAARYPPEVRETYVSNQLAIHIERKKQQIISEETRTIETIFRYPDEDILSVDERISMWEKSRFGKYFIQAGEIGAYLIVAAHMKGTNDPMWMNIVGNKDPQKAYHDMPKEFNAAVAARYLEGHLRVKEHPANKEHLGGMSVLEFANAHGIYIDYESPEVERGPEGYREGLYRLYDPLDIQHFIRKINSPYVKMCIDFEHMIGNKLDPDDMIKKAPGDFGSLIHLFHLGEPKPYWGTAHIPIPVGSQGQEAIYRWLYGLRKKGFKDGILIFERGGGRRAGGKMPYEVMEYSVWVLQQIKKYLEKDIAVKDLPPEFYGIAVESKDFWPRQLVTMREHAWDPLEGVLQIPEEKFTFLSKTAIEKGKGKEWEARKNR
ncbi:hypothetical protein ACFLQN_04535 [Candidatus Aenigmatarchaeota archaeon]